MFVGRISICGVNAFQLPLSGSRLERERGPEHPRVGFQLPLSGSLSSFGPTLYLAGREGFQLPLSGSQFNNELIVMRSARDLSTPSLGITELRFIELYQSNSFQLPLSGSPPQPSRPRCRRGSFNSLSRDHLGRRTLLMRRGPILSTFNSLSRDHLSTR